MSASPVLDVASPKSPDRLGRDLESAVAAHGFTVLGVHDLGAKLREKGQPYDGQCRVYEVCNAAQAARVLNDRPDVSTMLPCRISVFTVPEGGAHVATLLPSAIGGMFDSPNLAAVAAEVEDVLTRIVHDAAEGPSPA